MDFYLNEQNVYNRLEKEYKQFGKIIIAYDFDDTVHDFHKLGHKYDEIINLLKRWKEYAYFIVYTASKEERYNSIKEYLNSYNIPFDEINENIKLKNIPQGKKLYYNILLDDRAGLKESYEVLKKLINKIEKGDI